MAKNIEKLYATIINDWRNKKGVGSFLIPPPLNPNVVVLGVLQKLYERSPTLNIIIVVKDFSKRMEVVNFITHNNEDEENNTEFRKLIDQKYLVVYTQDYLTRWSYNNKFELCIFIGINEYTYEMDKIFNQSTFKLVCLTSLPSNVEDRSKLNNKCPIVSYSTIEILEINKQTPVEETRCAILNIDSEDRELLKRYDEYISQSVSIYGSFELMGQCRTGNSNANISANTIREHIAVNNGWSNNLDMSVGFNQQIDAMYNPNALLERAELTFDIIRKRSVLLSDNKAKLEKVLSICNDNKDKKILIISKRQEFAFEITQYLNNNTDDNTIICGHYIDKVESIPAVDENMKPIFVKSGINKGKQKQMGSTLQKKLNSRLFNIDKIRVLSTNNSADRDLECEIDLMIITSPLCDSLDNLRYRLNKVNFKGVPNKIIKLFIKDTAEEKVLMKETPSLNHKIVNENKIVSNFDENLGVVVVD